MNLVALILVLIAGGALSAAAHRWGARAPRIVALATMLACLPILFDLFSFQGEGWWMEVQWPWIPAFGVSFHFAADGLSAILIALTLLLGLLSVIVSWDLREHSGFYFLNLLWVLAGVVGVFTAVDLLLFFLFWEVMLVPMYFLIVLWGHESRLAAAMKFFIFTQASGLLLLAAIVGVAWSQYQASGRLTFDYFELLGRNFGVLAPWLMLGFSAAFAVKLPVVPFHTWLPDAHTQAPTAGSVLLAGILLKTGAYGLMRFAVPLFPDVARDWAPGAMAFGVFGIFYGALLAYGQSDIKRLVAYSSVSHMGFVLLGIFAFTEVARAGVVLQLVAHGVSTGALFILAGALQSRLHTRDLAQMGGLWSAMPRISAFGLFFAVASLGLPGLANFIAEFLILLGTFSAAPGWTAAAAAGLVAAAIYSLTLVQRAFHGEGPVGPWHDASRRETFVLGLLAAVVLWLGIAPQGVIDRVNGTPRMEMGQR